MQQVTVGAQPVVMVVDDELYVRDLLSRWLREAGYHCLQAKNGAEACRLLEEHEIALVTLDISMPDGFGLQILEWIGDRYPDTAVIMLTGEAKTEVAVAALTAGACGYLIKPIDRDQLLFHVRRGLERRGLIIDKRNYTMKLERRVREQTGELRRAYEEAIHRLVAACTYRDVETGGHIRRTGLLSEALARAAGWSADAADRMRLAAPMHDVGKIGIPDAILQKPARLTPEEFEIMKQHTVIGAEILAGSESTVLQLAETIALYHHEKWNGGGYPAGLSGRDIPESARIVAIVDVYDALTHGRIYREALSEPEALSMMIEESGAHFDPALLDLFLSQLPQMRRIAAANKDAPSPKSMIRLTTSHEHLDEEILVY